MRDQQFYDAVLLDNAEQLTELLMALSAVNSNKAAVGAFREAIERDRRNLVEIYLRLGISPNVQGNGNVRPLMWAAGAGNRILVRRLLDAGADIDAVDYRGWTALFYAVANQDLPIVKMLVAAGANIRHEVARAQGGTPLELARRRPVAIDLPDGAGTVVGRTHGGGPDTAVAKYLLRRLRRKPTEGF